MDKGQLLIARGFGYAITEIPGLRQVPKLKYYKPNGEEAVLPADPRSMRTYLSKGFTLEKPKSNSPDMFVCDTCGKEFSKKIALAGHRRSHQIGRLKIETIKGV